jgi:hypothetical protein
VRHAGGKAQRSDSGTAAAAAKPAARPTVVGLTASCAIGLSRRPVAVSRAASTQSLDQPIDSWPARKASATSTVVRVPASSIAASVVAVAVTTTVGPRCAAASRDPTAARLTPRS